MTLTAHQIRDLHQMCHRAWSAVASDLGLSFSEFEYLSVIKREEERMRIEDVHGQHVQDVVTALGVTKASASGMITKLEGRALVTRFQCKQDARAQHIVLTQAGTDLLAQGEAVYDRIARTLKDDG